MSQASSSTVRTRQSARVAQQTGAVVVVDAAAPLATAADLQAPIDDVTGLPLIVCPDCRGVRVFAATTTQSKYNNNRKRYFKCPRKNYRNGKCSSYWFEEEYVVYLHDNGYLALVCSTIAAALTTTEVPQLVGKIESLEQNLNLVKEMVGKNREGMSSFICIVCGCVNVTIFLILGIFLVVALLLK